jgi:polyhydroxyalkanoate synthesis regulator phasin
MKSNNIIEIAQQTFRIAIGATATLLETIQNSEKRSTVITDMQTELSQKSQQWAQKGEVTEQEARQTLEKLLQKTPWKGNSRNSATNDNNYTDTTVVNSVTKSELQSLTEQITALRNELEQLRNSNN